MNSVELQNRLLKALGIDEHYCRMPYLHENLIGSLVAYVSDDDQETRRGNLQEVQDIIDVLREVV